MIDEELKEVMTSLGKKIAFLTENTTRLEVQFETQRLERERLDAERQAKWEAERDAMNKKWDDWGMVQGQTAEDLFRRNIPSLLAKRNVVVETVNTNIKTPKGREYDIVAVNGREVYLFEIKNKLCSKDMDKFIENQMPDFKRDFPAYADHKVYGGVGGLVVKAEVEREAIKRGLFVLTQGGEETALLKAPERPVAV